MTFRQWEEAIETIQATVIKFVDETDWHTMNVFGPDSQGFGPPAICITADMNPDHLFDLAITLNTLLPNETGLITYHATTAITLT